jgi:hypothetical protein
MLLLKLRSFTSYLAEHPHTFHEEDGYRVKKYSSTSSLPPLTYFLRTTAQYYL